LASWPISGGSAVKPFRINLSWPVRLAHQSSRAVGSLLLTGAKAPPLSMHTTQRKPAECPWTSLPLCLGWLVPVLPALEPLSRLDPWPVPGYGRVTLQIETWLTPSWSHNPKPPRTNKRTRRA
jgi:hypothetical protein